MSNNTKHWERNENTKFGSCKKVVEIAYWDEYSDLGFDIMRSKEIPSKAVLGNNVWITEDFGCIKFETNESK